jgi:hypothetical protein
MNSRGNVLVGVLGQWASGKTIAARTLIEHLGGREAVIFITDRAFLAGQAVDHVLELEGSGMKCLTEESGRRCLVGEHAKFWLEPGQELETTELDDIAFYLDDECMALWHERARWELGRSICKQSTAGKPVVIEAAFGPDTELAGHPFKLSLSTLFSTLEEGGVHPSLVKWIIADAGFDVRATRNEARLAKVPVDVFAHFAADGGGLLPEERACLEERGAVFKRVSNDHADVEKFRADVVAAFGEIFEPA